MTLEERAVRLMQDAAELRAIIERDRIDTHSEEGRVCRECIREVERDLQMAFASMLWCGA